MSSSGVEGGKKQREPIRSGLLWLAGPVGTHYHHWGVWLQTIIAPDWISSHTRLRSTWLFLYGCFLTPGLYSTSEPHFFSCHEMHLTGDYIWKVPARLWNRHFYPICLSTREYRKCAGREAGPFYSVFCFCFLNSKDDQRIDCATRFPLQVFAVCQAPFVSALVNHLKAAGSP